jgi:hypothetical protein
MDSDSGEGLYCIGAAAHDAMIADLVLVGQSSLLKGQDSRRFSRCLLVDGEELYAMRTPECKASLVETKRRRENAALDTCVDRFSRLHFLPDKRRHDERATKRAYIAVRLATTQHLLFSWTNLPRPPELRSSRSPLALLALDGGSIASKQHLILTTSASLVLLPLAVSSWRVPFGIRFCKSRRKI